MPLGFGARPMRVQVGEPLQVDSELYQRLLGGRCPTWEAQDPGCGLAAEAPLLSEGQRRVTAGAVRLAQLVGQVLDQALASGAWGVWVRGEEAWPLEGGRGMGGGGDGAGGAGAGPGPGFRFARDVSPNGGQPRVRCGAPGARFRLHAEPYVAA